MISAFAISKNPAKIAAIFYLALYQVFLFQFFQTDSVFEYQEHSTKFYSGSKYVLTSDNSRTIDISKDEGRKEHEISSVPDTFSKLIASPNFSFNFYLVYTLFQSDNSRGSRNTLARKTIPRSPPETLS